MPNTLMFLKFLEHIYIVDLILMVVVVIVSFVVYSQPIIYEQRTHDYQYTWRLSAALIQGELTSTILLLFFIAGSFLLSFTVSRSTHTVILYEAEPNKHKQYKAISQMKEHIGQETASPLVGPQDDLENRELCYIDMSKDYQIQLRPLSGNYTNYLDKIVKSKIPESFNYIKDFASKCEPKFPVVEATEYFHDNSVALYNFKSFDDASKFMKWTEDKQDTVTGKALCCFLLQELKILELNTPDEFIGSLINCSMATLFLNEYLKERNLNGEVRYSQPPRILFARYQQRKLVLYFAPYSRQYDNSLNSLSRGFSSSNLGYSLLDLFCFASSTTQRQGNTKQDHRKAKQLLSEKFAIPIPELFKTTEAMDYLKPHFSVTGTYEFCKPVIFRRLLLRLLYFSVMISIVVCINILYVSAVVYYSGLQLIIVQFALGFFKLIYINVLLPSGLHLFDSYLVLKGHIKTRFLCLMGIMCSVVVDCVSVIGNIRLYLLALKTDYKRIFIF